MDQGEPTLPLEQFRDYLHVLARSQVGDRQGGKLDASDVVQQTLLEAHRKRSLYRGTSDAQLAGWLRAILGTTIGEALRVRGAQKRDARRERSLQAAIEESSARLEAWLASDQTSPSRQAHRQEQVLSLAQSLNQLPPAQRDALFLRYCRGWKIAQVAEHLGISPPSVVGLIQRGSEQLRNILKQSSS